MKYKNGYKKQKPKFSTCNWLKRYFVKRTCRKESDKKPIEYLLSISCQKCGAFIYGDVEKHRIECKDNVIESWSKELADRIGSQIIKEVENEK